MVVASFRYPGEFGALAPNLRTQPGETRGHAGELPGLLQRLDLRQIFVKSFGVAALTTLSASARHPVALLIAAVRSAPRPHGAALLLPFASNFLCGVYAG